VPRSVVMKLTGHKTEHVYKRYAIVAARDLVDGTAKLAMLHNSSGAAGTTVLPLRGTVGAQWVEKSRSPRARIRFMRGSTHRLWARRHQALTDNPLVTTFRPRPVSNYSKCCNSTIEALEPEMRDDKP
jgi:hypothetical protein